MASVTGTFDAVPVTVTAYPRVDYPATGDGSPTPVADVVVALSPSTVLSPAEPG